ncbi:hypothetical protein N9064_00640 [bacterium]|nr:hypothetical protein [bacterium]
MGICYEAVAGWGFELPEEEHFKDLVDPSSVEYDEDGEFEGIDDFSYEINKLLEVGLNSDCANYNGGYLNAEYTYAVLHRDKQTIKEELLEITKRLKLPEEPKIEWIAEVSSY